MHLRQGKPNDERRRRLLQEEVVGAPTREAAEAALARSQSEVVRDGPKYTPAANMDQQPRIVDLIPARASTIALWFLAGVAIIAGLEALYFYMPKVAQHTTDGRVAAFDLDGEGSLSQWYSAAILAACSLASLLVYTLRRHRVDDYRGRYRVWLWAAACWMVMSIDEGGSLHEGFKEMMTLLTGHRLLGDGSVWWIMAYGLVLSVLGIYLLLEMRCCWSSTSAMFMAAACYALAVVVQLDWIMPESGARGVMLEEGAEMLGGQFVLLGIVLHARYVIRDIQGLNTEKESEPADSKPRRRRKTTDVESSPAKAAAAVEPSASKSAPQPARSTPASRPTVKAADTKSETKSEAKSEAKAPASSSAVKTAPADKGNLRVDGPQPNAGRMSKAERKAAKRMRRKDDEFDDAEY